MKLVDSVNDVKLYHAEEFTTSASECRSAVTVGDELMFRGFPFCVEYTDETVEASDVDASACRWFDSVEGTLIRVFKLDNAWFTGTHRKLDASKSRWAAKTETFGGRFCEALRQSICPIGCELENDKEFLDFFYEKFLDATKKYAFLLRSSDEERIVCDAEPKPTILHVGTWNAANEFTCDERVKLFGTDVVPHPTELKLTTLKEVADRAKRSDPRLCQGAIGFDANGRVYKVLSTAYKYAFDIRGNVPSLNFRYLTLRKEGDDLQTQMFFNIYPKMRKASEEIERRITRLSEHLCRLYIAYYVRGEYVNASVCDEKALNIIHRVYGYDRIQTTPKKIAEILTKGSVVALNKLLKNRGPFDEAE